MKTLIICFFLILIFNKGFTQSLSEASKKVKIAFEVLKNHPDSKPKQLAYLKVFPQNKQQFIEIFDPVDFSQLYSDSFQYIDAFIALAKDYPTDVIDKSINIGKDLKWEADAIGDLQRSIVKLGNQNIDIFSKEVNALPTIETGHLIAFLADVENHKAYPEYQQLIEALQRIGENKLAAKFIKARAFRERNNHH